jgi:hypothetical protein
MAASVDHAAPIAMSFHSRHQRNLTSVPTRLPSAANDAQRVRAIFQLLAKVCDQTKNRLQIIVLDHAGESVWGEIPSVHLVEEWRDGQKLIPTNWLNA